MEDVNHSHLSSTYVFFAHYMYEGEEDRFEAN